MRAGWLLGLLLGLPGCCFGGGETAPPVPPSAVASAPTSSSPALTARAAPPTPAAPAPVAPPIRGVSNSGFIECLPPHDCQLGYESTFGYVNVYRLEAGAQVSAGGGRPFVAPTRGTMRDRGRVMPAWQSSLDPFPLNDYLDLPGSPAPPTAPRRSPYLPILVTYADGTTAEGYFRPTTLDESIVEATFRQVVDGPVPWPREGTGSSTVVLIPGRKPRVIGPATQWGDLGRVALAPTRRQRTRSCGSYGGGGVRTRVEVRAADETWRVFDRRTGERLAERLFSAEMPACPDATSSIVHEASPDRDAIVAWVESLP